MEAQCISSARWDLCGRCRVTGIPTAICLRFQRAAESTRKPLNAALLRKDIENKLPPTQPLHETARSPLNRGLERSRGAFDRLSDGHSRQRLFSLGIDRAVEFGRHGLLTANLATPL